MSVRNCVFPWHWLLITNDGEVMPCSHGSTAIGNLRINTIAEIWNGATIQEVRSSILRGEVHPVCRSLECPFQRSDLAFPQPSEPLEIKEQFARSFDETWYLMAYPDVAEAVKKRQLVSALEHFIRHGRVEGRKYRLKAKRRPKGLFQAFKDFVQRWVDTPSEELPQLPNSILGLVEYSLGRKKVTVPPVDIIIVVSTICNLSCVMCPHGMKLVERPRHMPIDILERAAPFIATASRLILSGLAEPLIAPAFWRVLELISQRDDMFVRVNSNGHLLTKERASRLLDSRLSEISFSIDAATSETYFKIRGADIDRTLAGICELLRMRTTRPDSKLEIFVNMTLMRENLHEAVSFVDLAKKLGADAVVFSQLFSFGDRLDWIVDRKSWRFVYSEQMLNRSPSESRQCIVETKARAERLAIPVIFLSNVLEYLHVEDVPEAELAEAAV